LLLRIGPAPLTAAKASCVWLLTKTVPEIE
jgi:hypothetical protein